MVLKLTLAAPYVSSPVAVCRWVRRILPRCPCLLLDFTSKLHSSVYCISIAAGASAPNFDWGGGSHRSHTRPVARPC